MTDESRQAAAPFPGADAIDSSAEVIIPPEQPPMDDAAGGPQGEQPADHVDLAEEEAIAQRGGLS